MMGAPWRKDFLKAYRKARSWDCDVVQAAYRAMRFALQGDTGRFRTHRGMRVSRIVRESDD